MCCCAGEYRARFLACSVIFHAITMVAGKGCILSRVGEILGLDDNIIILH